MPTDRHAGEKAGKVYDPSVLECEWYRHRGLYPAERITRALDGKEYVIGDWSWNRGGRPAEYIEARMKMERVYIFDTGKSR